MDINCDMGESYGNFKIGNDAAIFPYITSCNVACGFHGGDPLHIENTLEQAIAHKLQIGAHPSYPDLMGFGRKYIKFSPTELKAIIKYQLSAIKGMTESLGGKLSYVKPHGALYNALADNEEEAIATLEAIKAIDPKLAVMGLSGSRFEEITRQRDMVFIREGFADRRYLANGRLMPRTNAKALITTVQESIDQVFSMISRKKVTTAEGVLSLEVDSICIHGDNPLAPDILKAIRKKAEVEGFKLQKFQI